MDGLHIIYVPSFSILTIGLQVISYNIHYLHRIYRTPKDGTTRGYLSRGCNLDNDTVDGYVHGYSWILRNDLNAYSWIFITIRLDWIRLEWIFMEI